MAAAVWGNSRCGRTLTVAAGAAIACLLLLATSARAETKTVLNAGDAGADSLRGVVAEAASGDTIDFLPSLEGQTIELTSGAIDIDKSLTIEGLGASQLTIDAGHLSQIFTITEGDVSISGLTLANGKADETGGAIEGTGLGSLAVADSTFTGNAAGGEGGTLDLSGQGHGGAIYVSPSTSSLTVQRSTFTENTAGGDGGEGAASGRGRGGAIDYDGNGLLTVKDSTFSANGTGGAGGSELNSGLGRGGAIYVAAFAASTSVSGSTFAENTAGGDGGSGGFSGRGEGGAIKGDSGTGPLTVSGSTFTANTAGGQEGAGAGSGVGNGGAINSFSSLTVTGSTFAGNASGGQGEGGSGGAYGLGGAIHNFNNVSPLIVSGSTFTANTAGGDGAEGGGGAIRVSSVSGRSASISNSTLVGNAAGGGGGIGHGGAIEVSGPVSTTLASVTIDENEVGAGGAGAGIDGAESVTAKATIASGNSGATNCDAPVTSSTYSLEGPSAGETSCGFDLSSTDPELEPLADNGGPTETQALPESSPAVDVVPVASCPTSVDQRGEPRPDNREAFCDVGAYEWQDPTVAPAITSSATATFQAGRLASFAVTATGVPPPYLSEEGALPIGIGFIDNGNGTASLAGIPLPGTGGSYPLAIKASNGASPDATQSFTLVVQASPTVAIATPAANATYKQGQAVASSFACTEGPGGPGLASCVDQDGHPSGAAIDTTKAGKHTFTVTATSKDGLTGQASVTYTVVRFRPPPTPGPLRISIAHGRWAFVHHRRIRPRLACRGGAVGDVCRGTLWLTIGRRHPRKAHHSRRKMNHRIIVLARARYEVPTGHSRSVVLHLKRRGMRLLRRTHRHRLRARLIATLNGGRSAHRKVVLKLRRRRR